MSLLLVLGVSFGLCVFVMPLAKILATRIGLVDRPDGRRKIHSRPIPMAGGLSILIASSATLALAPLLFESLQASLDTERFRLFGLALASIAICAIGIADDRGCLRGRHKLIGQILAAFLLIQFDWTVRSLSFFGWHMDLGMMAVPFTICWLLAAINSLNLIDGMDGLLGTVGLILCAGLATLAAFDERWAMAYVAVALAGALLGFLRYNFPPANAFLGDAGSMLIGLVVGALALQCGQGDALGGSSVPLVIPIAFLTIPFLDTAAAIVRRKLTGRSVYTTDRGHLHHCLLRRGYSPRGALLWVALLCLICVGGGLVGAIVGQEWIAILVSTTVIAGLIATRMFGDAEFLLVRDRGHDMTLSLLRVPAESSGRQRVVRLQGTVDWAELWCNFIAGSEHLNLVMIRLNVNAPALHEGYHARWDNAHENGEDKTVWRAEIPLIAEGHLLGRLEVIGLQDQEPVRDKMDALLKLVEYFEAEAADLIQAKTVPTAPLVNGKTEGEPQPEVKAASVESVAAQA